MFELSGSRHFQQRSSWESSAFTNCMIAPVEHGQRESLPVSINPCRVSANSGYNGFGFSGLPDRGLTFGGNGSIQNSLPNFQTLLAQNQDNGKGISMFPAKVGEKPSAGELPQQKKFLIFDRSGNETRLIFSSLCPRVEKRTNPLPTCPAWNLPEESVGAYHQFLVEKQGRIAEQAWARTPALCEESGENEIIDEISVMHEDSDDINALLYSEDGDDDDGLNNDYDSVDDDNIDDEVSSGHSPLSTHKHPEKQDDENDFDNEVASKRQKAFQGGCKKVHQRSPIKDVNDGDLIGALEESVCPIVGNKRQRKDKIHDTLRVLENIIPGLKSKDPLVILDEAISYLKCLKYNAETMSMDASDSSGCYQPLR